MIVTIHQPDHLGYLGFYHKIMNADKFVVLDNVQFAKREFIHRNRIRGAQGAMWLSVPVLTKGRYKQKIQDVVINPTQSWQKEHWGRIYHSYCKAPYFDIYGPAFETIYKTPWEKLVDLNLRLIHTVFGMLDMEVDTCLASDLNVEGKATELLINITRAVGGDTYLSGPAGRDYMDEGLFEERGVRVVYNQFEHPEYDQSHKPFMPYMAVIDLLFNCGPRAMDVLRGAGHNGSER